MLKVLTARLIESYYKETIPIHSGHLFSYKYFYICACFSIGA